jgi:hypothetical protein
MNNLLSLVIIGVDGLFMLFVFVSILNDSRKIVLELSFSDRIVVLR